MTSVERLAQSLRERIGVKMRVYPKRKWRILESVDISHGICVIHFTDGTDMAVMPGMTFDYVATKPIDATGTIQ